MLYFTFLKEAINRFNTVIDVHQRSRPFLAYLIIAESEHENVPFSDINDEMKISPVQFARTIKKLTDADLVTIDIDPIDTRRKSCRLTTKGKAFKLELIEERQRIRKIMAKRTKEEWERMINEH